MSVPQNQPLSKPCIRLEQGSPRRFAYTDRVNGYLELDKESQGETGKGYFRAERQLLSDFFVSWNGTDLYRHNAREIAVQPSGFSIKYEKSVFDISLLIGEQAFYLSTRAEGGDRAWPGLVFPEACGEWFSYNDHGVHYWQDENGTAIASEVPFEVELTGEHALILVAARPEACFYLVFEADSAAARDKVTRLVREAAVSAHRQRVQEFLGQVALDTGNAEFEESVLWARFSAWMLATNDYGSGIWAGLPWFRDNWGRDTFIAISGTLLASGCFSEARAVITRFAECQNRDRSSVDYGRIPNRYRGPDDVIFNTADGTLWFIRAVWEYLQYSGDFSILDEVRSAIYLALETDLTLRTDVHGLLKHGDADTWMDARIRGKEPWSARGDRACDIQALWYTALCIGSRIAGFSGDTVRSAEWAAQARKTAHAFHHFFWSEDLNALADRLPPGSAGENRPDYRVRPNQLFALTVPSVLEDGKNNALLDSAVASRILENVNRELVTPAGLCSLCPDDPVFHPHHENPQWHHKDAAYHNGTIWVWNTGPYVSAACASGNETDRERAWQLLVNESRLIMGAGCAGSLSENIHAAPDAEGKPILSGTYSQAWSVSEYVRNVLQDIAGFRPCLTEKAVHFQPHLPRGVARWQLRAPFGNNWIMHIDITRLGDGTHSSVLRWEGPASGTLTVNGQELTAGGSLTVKTGSNGPRLPDASATLFMERDFQPPWCAAVRRRDNLEQIVLSGRYERGATGVLEWYFDSDLFKKKYCTTQKLGALWSASATVFRLWAPTARSVSLVLFAEGSESPARTVIPMQRGQEPDAAGVWEISCPGDLHGLYYQFRVQAHGLIRDTGDPYARAAGVNGIRSMVIDPERTNPPCWDSVTAPALASANDAIVYEVHIADISSSPTWTGPEALRRTYPGATATGTTCEGVPSGFDHIRSLGVTHLQLLPVFDFCTVDESRVKEKEYRDKVMTGAFNWGYDPGNYSVPEGSYSTDPFDGAVRIRELKGLVADCAASGLGVIMDVVYNHVPMAARNVLEKTVPGYYFRLDNYSGAGDDTASEREMFRRYMVDSLCWWLSEYKLCGFRFDLMGLHDVETMNEIATALKRIKSDVLIYGEGWDMYRAGKMVPASMVNARKMADIGHFNDALRCAIKGPVFDAAAGGFVQSGVREESVKFGLVGAVYHSQVHNRLVEGTANPNPWTVRTASSVNYTEIHDNATLYDKLVLVEPGEQESHYERLHRMSLALVLLAQGVPALHAGMEFMRTKEIPADILSSGAIPHDLYRTPDGKRAFTHNSYNLCDRINGLDWKRCAAKRQHVQFVRDLIALRRAHPMFRLRTAAEVDESLRFLDAESGVLAWMIDGSCSVDSWSAVLIAVNTSAKSRPLAVPLHPESRDWLTVCNGEVFLPEAEARRKTVKGGSKISLPAKSVHILRLS